MVSAFILLAAVALAFCAASEPVIGSITSSLQSILKNTHGSKDYVYPTDITRDIMPVRGFLWSFHNKWTSNTGHLDPCALA